MSEPEMKTGTSLPIREPCFLLLLLIHDKSFIVIVVDIDFNNSFDNR